MKNKNENEKDNVTVTDKVFRKIFAPENRWGIFIGVIVTVVIYLSDRFLQTLQFLRYILQAITVIIIPTALSAIINNTQREKFEAATEVALDKIEDKYKKISCNSTNLFKIFQLNDGGNFYNIAHNIFFNNLIKSYSSNAENRKYYISTDTYYKVIQDFLGIEYRLKTINGLLLPFWYAPKEKDDALKQYTKFCKENADLYERVTYYQDYENDDWKDNTVYMIYHDLLSSEKSDDVAVRWLITLIAKISDLRNKFGTDIKNILGKDLDKDFNYLQYRSNRLFNEAIKNNIKTINDYLDKTCDSITISRKMTDIINNKFLNDMRNKNNFVKKSVIDARFAENEINFEDVTEVGYYYKEKEGKEYDQFVLFLNGSNTGPSIEVEIITGEDKIAKIQQILSDLCKEDSGNN